MEVVIINENDCREYNAISLFTGCLKLFKLIENPNYVVMEFKGPWSPLTLSSLINI